MKTDERIKLVKAMEYIVRQVNDEMNLDLWFSLGVADGDIDYGDLSVAPEDAEFLEYYIRDEDFKDIMGLFLRVMKRACNSGGLFCDSILSD